VWKKKHCVDPCGFWGQSQESLVHSSSFFKYFSSARCVPGNVKSWHNDVNKEEALTCSYLCLVQEVEVDVKVDGYSAATCILWGRDSWSNLWRGDRGLFMACVKIKLCLKEFQLQGGNIFYDTEMPRSFSLREVAL
jgi:hypothetical protein